MAEEKEVDPKVKIIELAFAQYEREQKKKVADLEAKLLAEKKKNKSIKPAALKLAKAVLDGTAGTEDMARAVVALVMEENLNR